jgi:hypothetical protein
MIRLRPFGQMSSLCIPLAGLMLVSQCLMPTVAAAEAATVKVQMGTPVDLVFDTAVSGDAAVAGQQVTLRVANPVVVGGKTVVEAGAPAVGEIMVARKSGMVGMAGSIVVTIKSVTAVDGTIIALSGTKAAEGKSNVVTSVVITIVCCVLGLLMKGEKAEIPAGSTVRATAATQVEVTVP